MTNELAIAQLPQPQENLKLTIPELRNGPTATLHPFNIDNLADSQGVG